jgi:signal transduction histidine kinase
VDLIALVHQAVDDLELIQPPDQAHPPIVVQAQPGIESLFILGDAVRIAQIVQNLLTNALRYAPTSNHIDVRVSRVHEQGVPDKAKLEVQDYGPGIAEADLDFLFTPFYQAVNDRESHHGGLGLGLYVVQQLVKALGGEIKARSAEGHGAVFTILLPLFTEGQLGTVTPSDSSQERGADV